jgi:ribonuclease HII
MLNLETEKEIFKSGISYLAGTDEAGRGPLAGPVVAACVIIDANFKIQEGEKISLVADSKKLSAKKREELFHFIKDRALSVEISVINNEVIDKVNILKASLAAMKKSLEKSKIKADYVLVDGNFKIPNIDTPQKAIIGGDAKVWVIAAASIIAKVSRDFLMMEMDKLYPEYEFSKHKGYGTKLHLEKLKEFGPCPIHRKSFRPVKDLL